MGAGQHGPDTIGRGPSFRLHYTAQELHAVAELLRLSGNAVRIALAPWRRPRSSLHSDQVFVSVTVARPDFASYRVHASELDLSVGRELLVSAHKYRCLLLIARARGGTAQSRSPTHMDAALLVYMVLDELERRLQHEVESMEERANRETTDAFLEDLLRFKYYTFALSQFADEHREVFPAFVRSDFPWIEGAVEEWFDDPRLAWPGC